MKITVTLGNTSEAIQVLREYRENLESRKREFLLRLAEVGLETADVLFRSAQYDGTNDVTLSLRWENDNTVLVIAQGQAVTFIEFGSGIVYADDHPLAGKMGAQRGEYGQGKGSQRTWGYYGEAGTNGREHGDKGLVLTHGNPPARAMYEGSKAMRERIMQIAKEVFST